MAVDEMRTVHDPYEGRDVQISDRLVDRLRGQYACGPHLPNGNPEFGWRQFQAPPIQHEAAKRIEELEAALRSWRDDYSRSSDGLTITVPAYQIENLIGKKYGGCLERIER